jgi:predicted PurR-regulated permease PerM
MERSADQPGDGTPVQRVEVSVSTRSMAILVALVALIAIAIVLLDTLVSIAIALVFALALSIPVDALERRGVRRGLAAVLVFAAVFICVFILVAAIANPVYDEIRQFADALPGYVEDLENDSALQGLLEDTDLTQKVKDGLSDFAGELPSAASTLLGTAGGVFSSVLNLVTLTFLTLYLVVELPRIQHGIAALLRPENAERFEALSSEVARSVSMAVLGNLAISVFAGVVLGSAAWALGLPYPVVLGIVVGLLDLIPTIGATIAGVILGLVGLTVGLGPAVAIVVIDILYQQVENYIVQPAVMRQAVELSAFTTVAVVIIGFALFGVVGAIIAVPVAGAIRLILVDMTRDRRERMAALRASA